MNRHAPPTVITAQPMRPSTRAAGRGWIGLGLIALCWPLLWGSGHLRGLCFFFPLWLGYVLLVDSLAQHRSGSSLLHRSPRAFVELFAASVPVWFLFELLNERTHNWEYLMGDTLDGATALCLCALAFAAIMPAVLETAELVCTCGWVQRRKRGPRLLLNPRRAELWAGLGLFLLVLLLAWPRFFYWTMWICWFLLFDGANALRHKPSLLRYAYAGDWRPTVALSTAGL